MIGTAVTFAEILRLVRAHLALLFVASSLGLVAGYVHLSRQPTLYAASATGYLSAGSSRTVSELTRSQQLTATQAMALADLVGTRPVVDDVRRTLGADADFVSLSGSVPVPGMVEVRAVSEDPEGARLAANAGVERLIPVQSQLDNLNRPEGEPVAAAVSMTPIAGAVAPTEPFAPSYPRTLALGAGAGLLLGFGIAVLRRSIDSRMRTVADVDEVLRTGTLAMVPLSPDVAVSSSATDGGGAGREAVRVLRTNLRFVRVDHPPRVVVVTSAHAAEGKSTIARQLAEVTAAAGTPVVLVEADLRRPVLAQRLDLDAAAGLSNVLSGEVDIDDALQEVAPGLRVLTAGRIPPNPSEMLGGSRMQQLVDRLSADAFVVLDAPPLLPVTDAGLLAAHADGVVLVVRAGRTTKEAVTFCARALDQVGGRLLGVVLNGVRSRDLRGYGYAAARGDAGGAGSGPWPTRRVRARA